MSPENRRSDDYWMGVRDALRMVDSFLRWSKMNPDRAKPLEDFVRDGLVAAAKRCESCLHKELGVDFTSDEGTETSDISESAELSEIEDTDYAEDVPAPTFEPVSSEIVLEPAGTDETYEIPITIESDSEDIETADDTPSMDSLGIPSEGIEDDESVISGSPRDFSDDFELVEPDPLVIKPEDEESSYEEPSEPPIDEISVERPRYAWEIPVAGSKSDEHVPVDSPEPSSPAKEWSPLDEPSPEDIEEETPDEREDSALESPPPPPPPPETEESEDERRRRARRLFFGG